MEEAEKILEELRKEYGTAEGVDPLAVPVIIRPLPDGRAVWYDPLKGEGGVASSPREVEEAYRCPQCGAFHAWFKYV